MIENRDELYKATDCRETSKSSQKPYNGSCEYLLRPIYSPWKQNSVCQLNEEAIPEPCTGWLTDVLSPCKSFFWLLMSTLMKILHLTRYPFLTKDEKRVIFRNLVDFSVLNFILLFFFNITQWVTVQQNIVVMLVHNRHKVCIKTWRNKNNNI
jgi:hypothetical protein